MTKVLEERGAHRKFIVHYNKTSGKFWHGHICMVTWLTKSYVFEFKEAYICWIPFFMAI